MTRHGWSIGVAAALVLSAAVSARPKELTIALKWNPNEQQSIPAFDTTGGILPLSIAALTDKRDKGKQVGENTEESVPVPVYTSSDVPAYVHDHLTQQLKSIGLDITAAESGPRVLRADLVEFWVAEGKRYHGSVRLRVTIQDQSGKEIWSALVGGTSDNFGRSLKPDNYTESLSDAVQDLAAKLVGAQGFRTAIAKSS